MTSGRRFTGIFLIVLIFLTGCSSSTPKRAEYLAIQGEQASPRTNIQWPYTVQDVDSSATFYEPQISEWRDYQHAIAQLAVAVDVKGEDKTSYGLLQIEADTGVDFDSRKVFLSNLQVTDVRFPELTGKPLKRLTDYVKTQLIQQHRPVNLDLMLASLADSQGDLDSTAVNIEPPEIYYRAQPARLLMIDGKPLESPVQDVENLLFVINTNWDLFKDKQSGQYFLLESDRWLSAPDVKGPWHAADRLPDDFNRLGRLDMWKETASRLPARAWGDETAPEVVVSLSPAELIVTDGKPALSPIEGTTLSYVSNTDSDLFKAEKDGLWYYLVAGRWFSSENLSGPWKFGTPSLPEDFRLIPPEHEKARVLANVPGTMESRLSVIQTQIPVKGVVDRLQASVDVTYAGNPKFQNINDTKLQYAVNTSFDVIRYKEEYYVCYQAVWFVGQTAWGPFAVATSIPSDIHNIPPSHPLHHLTYVAIYEVTDSTVTTGYTAGYHHHYVYGNVVVWGTGWHYPPYWYYNYYYPVYYYYPYTYGIASAYDPVTGIYRQTGRIYGPYGGYGRSAVYNPRTGAYGRAEYAWDSNSGYGIGQAYHPRSGVSVFTEQAYDDYQRWGETVVRRGDEWASIRKSGDQRGTRRDIETSQGGTGTVLTDGDTRVGIGRSGEGDIYAGKDGQVYKRDEEGWYKREDGDWTPIDAGDAENAREQLKSNKDQVQSGLSEKGITGENLKAEADDRSIGGGSADAGVSASRNNNRQSYGTGDTYRQLESDRRARSESRVRSNRFENLQMNSGRFQGAGGALRRR